MSRPCRRLLVLAAVLAAVAGCAAAGTQVSASTDPRVVAVALGAGPRVVVRYDASDEGTAQAVAAAVPGAVTKAQRWGPLPVAAIVVHRSDEEFRTAVGATGRAEVRAWTRYDEVHLRPPRTWGPLGPSSGELDEVLAHELAHCVAYQRVGDRETWARRPLPFWFREGMAVETQAPALAPAIRARLRTFEAQRIPPPGESALERAELLLPSHPDLAYAAALVAFDTLVERHGEGAAGGILDRMRAGAPFAIAFHDATGEPVEAFDAAVRRAVVTPP